MAFSLKRLQSTTSLYELFPVIRELSAGLLIELEGHKMAHKSTKARSLLQHLYRDTVSAMDMLEASIKRNGTSSKSQSRLLSSKVAALDSRHNMVIESIAEVKQSSDVASVDSMVRQQLKLMTLLQHTYHLTNERYFHETGCVHQNCDIIPILQGARSQARSVAEHHFVDIPDVLFNGAEQVKITLVPAHLNFAMQEVMKNALHATLLTHHTIGHKEEDALLAPVQVLVEETDDALVITTRDEGIGMSSDALMRATTFLGGAKSNPMLLTESQASYQPMSAPLAGLGAGLSLSRVYCEMFGGVLNVHSAGEGKGCEVRIELPRDTSIPWTEEE